MAALPEPEASLLAIVFEETGAYHYRSKQAEPDSRGAGPAGKSGLERGFEEDFSFGEDDPNDYWHFKDNGVEIVD